LPFDLLIQNGEIIDASRSLRGRYDVGVSDGRITALEPSLPADGAGRVIDAAGMLVTPGLIDMHVHAFLGTDLAVDIDAIGARSGTTTAVDTGSAGAHIFDAFRRFVIAHATTRILPFLNISTIGTTSILLAGELENIRYCNVEEAVRCVERHRDLIIGIKVRSSGNVLGQNGLVPIELARAAAERTGLPMMVHIGMGQPAAQDLLERMRPGDILTHCYTGFEQRLLDPRGQLLPAAAQARERGVFMDIGHGMGSLSVDVARRMLELGFLPDTISTDLHAYCWPEPVHDLPTTLSKFLALGMRLENALAAATEAPARILQLGDGLGTLQPGAIADIAIFELKRGECGFVDSYGQRFTGTEQLVNTATIKGGTVLYQAAAAQPA
jgi:dihydroorotase